MAYDLIRVCETCGGDGEVVRGYPSQTETCGRCGGSGHFVFGTTPDAANAEDILKDIADRCNDILDKCKDILERLPKV